jgi:hypothetical protein
MGGYGAIRNGFKNSDVFGKHRGVFFRADNGRPCADCRNRRAPRRKEIRLRA